MRRTHFAAEAIEEADEVLFIAGGEDPGLSALERHALEARGAANCRLVFQRASAGPVKRAAEWVERRGYGRAQAVDFASPAALQLMGAGLAGKGHAIAAASAGVYAAAILGALQALEEHGMPAVSLVAAGVPSCPPAFWRAESLGRPTRFSRNSPTRRCGSAHRGRKRASSIPFRSTISGARSRTGDCRRHPALCRRLSFAFGGRGRSASHGQAARRGWAGIAPPGMLPPLIVEGGDILVSGENEAQALLRAAGSLAPRRCCPSAPGSSRSALVR